MDSTIKVIKKTSQTNGNKIALVINDERITYKDFYENIKSFSAYLYDIGFKKGDYIVARALCSKYYYISMLGTILAGGIFIPLQKDYPSSRFESLNNELNKIFLLISNNNDSDLKDSLNINYLDYDDFSNVLKKTDKEFEEPDEHDTSFILFTTGTTGKAKGVCLPYCYMHRSLYNIRGPYNPNTILMVSSPLNHVFAIGRSLALYTAGGTLVVMDGIGDLEQFYRYIDKEKVNGLTFSPSAINYLLALTKEELLSRLKQYEFFEIGGEKLLKSAQESYISSFPGVRLFNGYASTESGPIGLYEFSKYGPTENRVGTMKDTIKFIDENGNFFKADKEHPGYIVSEADWAMKYYYKDEEETKKVKRDNYIIMSDYGYVDDEGFLCLSGRAGDVIITGAYKVNPTDVENVAMETGLIQECICIGKKDEIFGKKVALLVVMKEGIPFDKIQIKKFISSKLEKHMVPKTIIEVDKIQRNRNGKIDRKYYREIENNE